MLVTKGFWNLVDRCGAFGSGWTVRTTAAAATSVEAARCGTRSSGSRGLGKPRATATASTTTLTVKATHASQATTASAVRKR